jgi:ABC-2 type transport system ATP-binding protein
MTMLQLVDLDGWRDSDVGSLSRGLRQRLAIATAMVHDPEIMILDEPFAGQDGQGREEMTEILRELKDMGKTIVISSHATDEVRRLCDAVGFLSKGRLVSSGPLAELVAEERPREIRVTIELATGMESAKTTLAQLRQVQELTADDVHLTFVFSGDRGELSGVIERLVGSGVRIIEFAVRNGGVEDALTRTLREVAA